MVLVTVPEIKSVLIKKNPRRNQSSGIFLDDLFSGFLKDDFRKVLADFAQVPCVAGQKDKLAVMVFGNIHL